MTDSASPQLPAYRMGQETSPSSPVILSPDPASVLMSPPPGYASQHQPSLISPTLSGLSIGNGNNSRYFNSTEPISPQSTLRSRPSTLTPRPISQALPSNYVKIARKGSAKEPSPYKGNFTINPNLNIPADILTAISSGRRTSRKNLDLTVEEGSIDVDVLLTGEENAEAISSQPTITGGAPVTLELGLITNPAGERDNIYPVIARIHAPSHRPPFHLKISACNPQTGERVNKSRISVHLPRTFCGPISFTNQSTDISKRIHLSRDMRATAVLLNETESSRSYSVGVLERTMNESDSWKGDRVTVNFGSGTVHLQYLDEFGTSWFEVACNSFVRKIEMFGSEICCSCC